MATTPTLLAKFQEIARHTRIYTGGKVDTHVPAADGAHSFFVCACGPELNVVDITTGRLLLVVPCDEDDFTAFALAPSGTELVTAGRSRQLRSWVLDVGVTTCEFTRVWKAHKMPVMDLAYDASGRFVASGSADSTAMVFDVAKGIATHVFRGHTGVVHLVRFHPDASRLHLYTSGADNGVRVWDLRSRACVAELKSHVGLPTAIAFSADGATILTAGRDQLVNVWNAATHSLTTSIAALEPLEALVVLPAAAKSAVAKPPPPAAAAAAGPPPLQFVTAGESGLLRCWDARTGKLLRKQPAGSARQARPGLTRLVPAGASTVLAATADHNLIFHGIATLAPARCIAGNNDEITYVRCLPAHAGASASDSLTADGSAVAANGRIAVATNAAQVKLFDTHDMGCRLLFGHTDVVLALDVSSDGALLASSSKDCTARVWGVESGACVAVCDGHVEAVGGLAFARRSAALLTASKDKTIKLWDLSAVYPKGASAAGGAAGSKSTAAGRKSAAAAGAAGSAGPAGPTSGAEVEVVRARAMSTVLGHTKEVNAVAMAPNDRLAVSASQDRTLKVWSLEGGALKEMGVLKGHKRAVWCVSFSPVDKAVASGGGDASVKIWSVSDFSCLRTLEGHSSSVLRILWLSSGLQLLSSGSDGLIKLWSAKASECACTLDAHEDKVWALDALETASGGVELWSGSADSLLVRWKDCTFEAQQETVAARELLLQQESQLQIAMHAQQFDEALKLALRLGHPRALRTVLERLLPLPLGEMKLREALAAMDDADTGLCLQFARDWNTTAQHSLTAQRLMYNLLKVRPVTQLLATPKLQPLLEALLPYTERHFERLDRLIQGTHLLAFTLAEIRGLAAAAPPIPEPLPEPIPLAVPASVGAIASAHGHSRGLDEDEHEDEPEDEGDDDAEEDEEVDEDEEVEEEEEDDAPPPAPPPMPAGAKRRRRA